MLWIATKLGISLFRVWIYGAAIAAVTIGAVALRQHYVNIGWDKHKVAVEKQDSRTVAASKAIEEKVAKCQEGINGYWDVITQGCKLEDAN